MIFPLQNYISRAGTYKVDLYYKCTIIMTFTTQDPQPPEKVIGILQKL
jgi:hypothetical protein